MEKVEKDLKCAFRIKIRLVIYGLLAISILSLTAISQETVRQVMVGPRNDHIRATVAFITAARKTHKTRALTVDVGPERDDLDKPVSFQVDLASTVRWESDGTIKQKLFSLRWDKTEGIELKCRGAWSKKPADDVLNEIVGGARAVVENVPLDVRTLRRVLIPADVDKKVNGLLDKLDLEILPCQQSIE